MKLLKDFVENDLTFKKVRETNTGSRIIDVINQEYIQTPWLQIRYEVDHSICVNADKIKDVLSVIDTKIITHSSNILDFSIDEISSMYKCLLRQTGYFSIPISSNTILFDSSKDSNLERKYYDKSEIKNILKIGNYVRFIIKFKKIYFKDHNITFPIELIQIELA